MRKTIYKHPITISEEILIHYSIMIEGTSTGTSSDGNDTFAPARRVFL